MQRLPAQKIINYATAAIVITIAWNAVHTLLKK